MKKWEKLLSIFMSGAILITGGVLPKKNTAIAEGAANYGISNPRIENGVTTWDKIKFGSYYQDAEVQPAEPIKWRVLWVDEDKNDAFLLADRNLDAKPYNEENTDVTWETCTLRKWLNEDFYNEAFDAEEKKAVKETKVVNEDNAEHGTEGGNDTTDKIYLLSIAEACNAAYGFDTEFHMRSETRESKNTDYAKVKGARSIYSNGEWWLRSPGNSSNYVAHVYNVGYGDDSGYTVDYGENGVRPAVHINLSSSKIKDAGEVDSEGNVTESADGINAPRVEYGVTTWDCVYFGSYRQNFSVKQDIEWRVLSVAGDDAFLLADRNLDARPYNEENESVTWETCTLRKWLNGDFYNEAFDSEEKKSVKETRVVNENNQFLDTEGGSDTTDKVYLLSIAEICNTTYGFDTIINKNSKTRESENTDYAKAKGSDSNTDFATAGKGEWWLRSPGYDSGSAVHVHYDGYVDYIGDNVFYIDNVVRPALHINLSSSSWSKAGEETAVRNDEPEASASPEPTKEPEGTQKPASTAEPTKKPEETERPSVTTEPTNQPEGTGTPSVTTEPQEHDKPSVTAEPSQTQAPSVIVTQKPAPTVQPVFKQLKLSSVKCAKNAKKITGRVSVSKVSVKIKVGKKAYKKAAVKGKKFTFKLNYKLKKKTKVIIKAQKKGYKSEVKTYMVK